MQSVPMSIVLFATFLSPLLSLPVHSGTERGTALDSAVSGRAVVPGSFRDGRHRERDQQSRSTKTALAGEPRLRGGPGGGGGFTDPETGMEFVAVPGGCFERGDTFGDGDADERPVHLVCVVGFHLGKYEVTQGQWEAVMGNNPSRFTGCGSACPVEQVSWNEVQGFIRELNQLSERTYRLPTEAEWEYAARSGGKKERWAGTSSGSRLGGYAWYRDNSGYRARPVGGKRPNGLGLYDLTGNVWEWCRDWYGARYYGEGLTDNPPGPVSGTHRVLRGGSWLSGMWFMRASLRFWVKPSHRTHNYGFRVAASVP